MAAASATFLAEAFPRGQTTLANVPYGPEVQSLLVPLVKEALETGPGVLLALSSLSPERVFRQLAFADVDVETHRKAGSLVVVDWYSHKEGDRLEVEREEGIARCPATPEALEEALEMELKSGESWGLVVLDVLTDLSWFGADRFGAFLDRWVGPLSEAADRAVLLLNADLVPASARAQSAEVAEGTVALERVRSDDGPAWRLTLGHGDDARSVGLRTAPPFVEFTLADVPTEVPAEPEAEAEAGAEAEGEPVPAAPSCPQCGEPLEEDACASCGYSEEEARLERIRAIHQACEERLGEDPEDLDALFTKAVALARLRDYGGAIAALNELTRHDPRYPALWMLKAKVFDRLGDEVKANLCRQRALELEREELGPGLEVRVQEEEGTFQCPLCHRTLPLEATVCPCGAEFVEEED